MSKTTTTTIFLCGAAADALGTDLRPAAVAVRAGRIAAVGSLASVEQEISGPVRRVHRPELLVLPGMVNAHAHLDLTAMGPRPYGGSFLGWIRDLMKAAPAGATAEASVRRGVEMSAEAGVEVVGDIARSMDSARALVASADRLIAAVSFAECFGIGAGYERGRAAMDHRAEEIMQITGAAGKVRPGLEPHAPYSAAKELFDHAAELSERTGLRLTTHLAETQEELQFLRDADGPMADLLRGLNLWDRSIQPGQEHPVDFLGHVLPRRPWLLAHCNYVQTRHIAALARHGASVAYCPIASEYFGHRGHRWREMLEAGVNVCLGTDSILCQPAAEAQPLGILPQMRLLYRRDGASPAVLLEMATTRGLRALGLEESLADLRPGSPAPLGGVRFDPGDPTPALSQVLGNGYAFEMLE